MLLITIRRGSRSSSNRLKWLGSQREDQVRHGGVIFLPHHLFEPRHLPKEIPAVVMDLPLPLRQSAQLFLLRQF